MPLFLLHGVFAKRNRVDCFQKFRGQQHMIQNLSKELFELAEKGSGRLPNRVVFYCDEFGTMPAFDVEALFSAGRSRGITLVPIIQSLAQLDKNYGDKGAESIVDNC